MLPISNLFEFYPAVCEMEHVDTTTSLWAYFMHFVQVTCNNVYDSDGTWNRDLNVGVVEVHFEVY
jgi:hypothetical protein